MHLDYIGLYLLECTFQPSPVPSHTISTALRAGKLRHAESELPLTETAKGGIRGQVFCIQYSL